MAVPAAQQTALITGASSGIGEAFAGLLAREGYGLVLCARNEDGLNRVAGVLTTNHTVPITVIACDLGQPGGPQKLADELEQRAIVPDVVINNAGFGLLGRAARRARTSQIEMVDLNVRALTDLTLRYLPAMITRKSGGVINVASTAGYFPGPYMAVYYATKAFVISFCEALGIETAGSGVTVTALCPGPVRTGFQARAGMQDLKLLKYLPAMTAEDTAALGWAGFQRGSSVVVPGVANTLTVWSSRLLPRRLTARLIALLQRPKKG